MNSLYEIETQWSAPLEVSGRKIVLQSRAVRIRVPFVRGGLVWNRPVAALVQFADGRDQMLPVHDDTRRAQIFLGLYALVAAWIIIGVSRRKRG